MRLPRPRLSRWLSLQNSMRMMGFPAGEGEEAGRPGAEDEEMSRAEQEIAALVEQVGVGSTSSQPYLHSPFL